jgi:hypothetical protein
MKRILFLAPYSFPINSPEAICNAKLLMALGKEGYIIDVISKNNNLAYVPNVIVSLFSKNMASIKTFVLKNKITIRTIYDHIKTFFKTGYIYKGSHWAIYAIKYGEKLIRLNHYDYILSRNPPSEIVGLYLSKKYNIPWIANWNDPYPEKRMPVPYGGGPDKRISYFQRKLIKNICNYATYQTFPSLRERDYMFQYMNFDLKKTRIIPHICIHGLYKKPNENQNKQKKLKIVHSGSVSIPRDPYPFLLGLKIFLNKYPNANILANFIGKQTDDFKEKVASLNLVEYINILNPLDYIANLEFIDTQDIALIIEAPSENSVFLPTKVSDYMQCGKDIFAISPLNGVLNDLYRAGVVKYFANCIEKDDIAQEIEKIYALYLKNNYYLNNAVIYSEYSEKNIMKLYADVFR